MWRICVWEGNALNWIDVCFPQIYRGYVDDPRNTDNSWMETVAVNFHDDFGDSVGRMDLNAGKLQVLHSVGCWGFFTN